MSRAPHPMECETMPQPERIELPNGDVWIANPSHPEIGHLVSNGRIVAPCFYREAIEHHYPRLTAMRPVEASPLPGDEIALARTINTNFFNLERDESGAIIAGTADLNGLAKLLVTYREQATAPLLEALEAADSMATSFENGELAGWEVALYRRRRAAHPTKAEVSNSLHDFKPDPQYPWFCEHCGYAPHERLKHTQPSKAESLEVDNG